jgi:tRNA A58 N-methylase Trm61
MKLSEKTLDDRVTILENDIRQIKENLRKKTERIALTLKEKFSIHDHAQNLLAEFEEIPDVTNLTCHDQLQKIIKSLESLVDNALGITP